MLPAEVVPRDEQSHHRGKCASSFWLSPSQPLSASVSMSQNAVNLGRIADLSRIEGILPGKLCKALLDQDVKRERLHVDRFRSARSHFHQKFGAGCVVKSNPALLVPVHQVPYARYLCAIIANAGPDRYEWVLA
jgi:hypothetical protein